MPDLLLGGIAINEILIDPNGDNNFDTDGSGRARGGDEFIELINTSGSAIDISGVQLWDAGRDNWFTFPPGSVLQPGAVAVVVRNVQNGGSLPAVSGNDLAFDADFGRNVFNNNGDNVVVYDPSNDQFIQASYNGAPINDPTAGGGYQGFPSSATRVGSGENFGNDQDGFSIQRVSGGFENNLTPTPGSANVCFASGTKIATPDGMVVIEDLKVGDRICTRRSGPQPIRWIFSRRISQGEMRAHPNLRPIVLPGPEPLFVSRQHRVLVTGKIADRMFGKTELVVPAKDLLGYSGCRISSANHSLDYFHILLDRHHIINANGVGAESLYLGREGVMAMCPAAREELASIYPQIVQAGSFVPPALCRHPAAGHRARQMVQRYQKNGKELLTLF